MTTTKNETTAEKNARLDAEFEAQRYAMLAREARFEAAACERERSGRNARRIVSGL